MQIVKDKIVTLLLTPFFFFFVSSFHSTSAVVFGKVVEGMDVVKAVEAVGSSSGATSAKVIIEASGQL